MTASSPKTIAAAQTALAGARPLTAALWMGGAVASFAIMAVAGRELSAELDTFEIMAYRSVIGFIIVCALVFGSARGFSQIATRRPGLHVVRNVFHFAGQNLWFYGVAVIPLAQLVALEFTNPIWVALLAPLLLSERITKWRILAAIMGFVGVLIVARPGVAPFEWGHAAGLGAALGFALNTIFTKELSRTDSTLCVLFWMTLSQAAMGFALAAFGGMALFSWAMTPWVVVVGICGLTAHYSLTSALANAPASVVAPMEFLRLPVLAVVGMLMYGESLEIAVFVGGAIILAGNLLNINVERRRPSDR
ncbi:MAG: DMT family transporter [Pseudomonadota bacterium]